MVSYAAQTLLLWSRVVFKTRVHTCRVYFKNLCHIPVSCPYRCSRVHATWIVSHVCALCAKRRHNYIILKLSSLILHGINHTHLLLGLVPSLTEKEHPDPSYQNTQKKHQDHSYQNEHRSGI